LAPDRFDPVARSIERLAAVPGGLPGVPSGREPLGFAPEMLDPVALSIARLAAVPGGLADVPVVAVLAE
jgi:hypothetical protein